MEKNEKKRLAILKILKEANRPLPGSKIAEQLTALGHDISERTVRLYLQEMDADYLTENFGKRGRLITALGLTELESARIVEKVGFLSAKIDQMTYLMDFDYTQRKGKVVINVSLLTRDQLQSGYEMMGDVFAKGFAMGKLVTILRPNERVGDIVIPKGCFGVGTVCSITLNGVLLHQGIPTTSRFGGLLEIHDREPVRFMDLITYDGTTLDPLEVFIRSGMTDYLGAINKGSGRIGASFREFPAAGRARVVELASQLEKIGLGGFMKIGGEGVPLLEIPVGEGRVGAVVIGGLNPVAVLEESGIRIFSRALAGLIDFDRLFHFSEMKQRIKKMV